MAAVKPNTVVTNACEIPPAINFGSPVPNNVIAWKVTIMPVTVPRSPRRGATDYNNLIKLIPLSSEGNSFKIASSNFSSKV